MQCARQPDGGAEQTELEKKVEEGSKWKEADAKVAKAGEKPRTAEGRDDNAKLDKMMTRAQAWY